MNIEMYSKPHLNYLKGDRYMLYRILEVLIAGSLAVALHVSLTPRCHWCRPPGHASSSSSSSSAHLASSVCA